MGDSNNSPGANHEKSPEKSEKNMREEIIDAAAQLFKKKGYNGTSMQDIAKEVGILKGSIYYHFNSKNEIFREVLHNGINPVLRNAEQIVSENISSKEKLRKLFNYHISYIMDHNLSLLIYFQEREKLPAAQMEEYLAKRNNYENIFREIMKEGIEQGLFPEDNVNLTVFAIFGMCNWIIQWYNPKGTQSAEEIKSHMEFLIFERLLCKDK